MNQVVVIVAGALLAMSCAVIRLVRGPTQADRVVALDIVFSSNIALSAAAALVADNPVFLDTGIGLSIVGFVATILWARLIDKSPETEELDATTIQRPWDEEGSSS